MRVVLRLSLFIVVLLIVVAVYWQQTINSNPFPKLLARSAYVNVVTVQITATPPPPVVVYITATPAPIPTATPIINAARLLETYQAAQYTVLEEMPPDLFHYYSTTVAEIAAFFDVRVADLLTVLQAQNDGFFVLQNERPGGIAGLSTVVWNGRAAPSQDRYLSDVRLIAHYGGLGFDWSQHTMWTQWTEQGGDSINLNGAEASPTEFTDGVATLAYTLAVKGVTASAATSDPDGATTRIAGVLHALTQGVPSTLPILATEGQDPVVSQPLRDAFNSEMDQRFGVQWSDTDLEATVDRSDVALAVVNGTMSAENGATELAEQVTAYYLADAQRALEEGQTVVWPFISDERTMRAQQLAVNAIGHTLAPWEVETLLRSVSNDFNTYEGRLASRTDARLFNGARSRLDEGLGRSDQGLPLLNVEVARMVEPLIEHHTMGRTSSSIQGLLDGIEYQIRTLPEFQARNGKLFFEANPLDPWNDNIILRFGAPADYQPGGLHTGVDVRGQREQGKEPVLYAVDNAVVVRVGPIYCLGPEVCRGAHAIILDHGNNVYSIYSHNSEAWVNEGDTVTAGQAIGRQGDEGYSRRSHLHFEVHVGAPYTSVWQEPFRAGEFINPLPWLPRTLTVD